MGAGEPGIAITRFEAGTVDGWRLALRRVVHRDHLDSALPPILIVPGYGMNSFILGYHPRGLSMEAYLAGRGFEVWVADQRGQGGSWHPDGRDAYGFEDLALRDVTALLEAVAEHTTTEHERFHTLGCSLGGSVLYAHLACRGDTPIRSVAALGAPLRWEKVGALVRLAFASPTLAGLFPYRGNQKMAGLLLPLALRVPKLLHFYMHPEISDTSNYRELLKTVADTSPRLNRQIAFWIRDKDLLVEGTNVSRAAQRFDVPLLCVVANADGVVPAESALSAHEEWGHRDKRVLVVGDTNRRFAHADLFISDYSEELVFRPLADWFAARSEDASNGA